MNDSKCDAKAVYLADSLHKQQSFLELLYRDKINTAHEISLHPLES